MAAPLRVGLLGARGHVGRELLGILEQHPHLEVAWVVSRSVAGHKVADHVPGSRLGLLFEDLSPAQVAERGVDAVVLALANKEAAPYVQALQERSPHTVMVDVSADHRFTSEWAYGLPEHFRASLKGARRIANPGCYATGAQVGLWPVRGLLAGVPSVFGVSGYSGAGATPNPRNDLEALRDNVMPYSLTDHLHEREVARHLGHAVAFVPHVAPFFRGMVLTITAPLTRALTAVELKDAFVRTYAGEPLIRITDDIPLPRDAAGKHGVTVGGFSVHAEQARGVWVVTLDNLLKGAATQAIQNLNLALGFPELEGIRP